MRLILTLILALPLCAQLDIPLMSKRPSLSRSGLAAGVNVTGGVDTQSIASIPPGTATLVRGANTGASSDDPVVSRLGWTFDASDRVSGVPAKGTNWTTINCSNEHCYGVDSASGSFVDGVASVGATEFNLETAGGFTGTLTYFLRYNRVITAKEHRDAYRTWIKPRVNAVGGTLP